MVYDYAESGFPNFSVDLADIGSDSIYFIKDVVIEDSDGDGIIDSADNCPSVSNPGQDDIDSDNIGDVCDDDKDGDGILNNDDGCPADPLKTDPGTCGCGVADTDSDEDGTPDCNDLCPDDINKIAEGICGCGISDSDSDNDGKVLCQDNCPNDFNPDQTDTILTAKAMPVIPILTVTDGTIRLTIVSMFRTLTRKIPILTGLEMSAITILTATRS
jgi:hypothetical protein